MQWSFETACSFCYLFRKRPVGLNLQSPLSFSLLLTLLTLYPQLKPGCLISNLLRTLSPLGDCGLTRHNIRTSWPEKDPKQRKGQRQGKRWNRGWLWMGAVQGWGESQGNYIWCLGMSKAVLISVAASGSFELKASPRMRQKFEDASGLCRRFVSWILRYMHRNACKLTAFIHWIPLWKLKRDKHWKHKKTTLAFSK